MIARIVDGGNMVGLMLYLTGPGRANEHTSPHLVTGDGALCGISNTTTKNDGRSSPRPRPWRWPIPSTGT